jgi:hypothetical protein
MLVAGAAEVAMQHEDFVGRTLSGERYRTVTVLAVLRQ